MGMKTLFRTYPTLLAGLSFALLALTGCATSGPDREAAPQSPQTVDTGYGTAEADRFLGSASTTRAEDEPMGEAITLVKMLARLPGVRVIELPQGEISVRVRGVSNSIIGNSDPLFVLDGIPLPSVETGLNSINPNTIESITVLKDAGSTAMYGSRGANGVILIRTKR